MYASLRSRWAAIGAAVAVTLGAGGLVGVNAADDVSSLVPITPVRILDTRSGDRVGSLDAAGNSTPHRLKVTGSPGIPASGVTGVSLNVTAVDTQANEYGGFVTVYPCASTSAARPDVSNLNFVSGQTLANSVTIPVSADGHVCVYVYGTAHILADANGYYTKSAPDPVDAYTRGETDTLIDTKADQTDLDTLETTVGGKANQTDLNTLSNTVTTIYERTDGLSDALETKIDGDVLRRIPSVPTSVDTDGDVGPNTSIAIGVDGNPVIAYYDHTNLLDRLLKVAACNDPTCTDSTVTTIDSSGGDSSFTSIAIGVDGNPVIAYYDDTNRDLKIAVCTNPTCTTNTITTVDTTGAVGSFTSIAIGVDGNPVIAYQDYDGVAQEGALKLAICNNATCTNPILRTIDSNGDVGYDTSIAVGIDGNPVISYYDHTDGNLKVAICNNPTCTNPLLRTAASNGDVGNNTSIAIGIDGNPVIAHYDASISGDLLVAACTNPTCDGSTPRTIDNGGDDGSGNGDNVGYDTSIAIGIDGNPVISYYDATNENLKVAICSDPTCDDSTPSLIDTYTIDTTGDVGSFTSIAIGVNGTPVISYYDATNGALKVAGLWWATGGR